MEGVQFKTLDQMIADDHIMHEATYRAYLRDAGSFLKRCVSKWSVEDAAETSINEGDLLVALHFPALDQLINVEAAKRTGDSWRKLRRSLAVLFYSIGHEDVGNKINETKNPMPAAQRPRKTGKAKRLTTVTLDNMNHMLDYLLLKDESMCLAMCILGRDLGLRPCEMNDIKVLDDDGKEMHLFITGAKKTKLGDLEPDVQRGIDRELIAISTTELRAAISTCNKMTDKRLNSCRERIRRASKKLWPQRKKSFCLYSLRYTIGSNLKAEYQGDPLSSIKIAATMGHKNISSASDYGNIRSANGFGVPRTTPETLEQVVIDRRGFDGIRHKIAALRSQQSLPSVAPSM